MKGSLVAALFSGVVIVAAGRQIVVAVHVMAVIAWMAGIFYLPRLYVYHCKALEGGELDAALKVMERKLFWFIMQPAMVIAVLLGFHLAGFWFKQAAQGGFGWWAVVKAILGFGMVAFHGFLGFSQYRFAHGTNFVSERGWRFLNEVPTLLMIAMVYLAIVKPF